MQTGALIKNKLGLRGRFFSCVDCREFQSVHEKWGKRRKGVAGHIQFPRVRRLWKKKNILSLARNNVKCIRQKAERRKMRVVKKCPMGCLEDKCITLSSVPLLRILHLRNYFGEADVLKHVFLYYNFHLLIGSRIHLSQLIFDIKLRRPTHRVIFSRRTDPLNHYSKKSKADIRH